MPDKINKIAKNTSYFTFALIIQKVISFTFFAILARSLPPESLGKYFLAISFTTIFAIFIDLGLANVLVREVAKDKTRASRLLSGVLAIKITLAILTTAAIAVTLKIMGYPELTRDLVWLSSVCMILDSFTLAFFSAIRGFHNLRYESVSSVIFQLIVLIFGLVAIRAGLGLRWLMGSLIAASVFNFSYSFSLVKFRFRLKIRPDFDPALLKSLAAITAPFALFAVFQRLYTYFDTILLSKFAGDYYVGLYQVSFKIIFALQFLPMAFIASVYPAFSDYWKNNREQLGVTFERAVNYLMIIGLPISAGIAVLAGDIMLIFKSDYAAAVLPLRIVVTALFFIFLNFPIGALLNACDRQKINTRNMGLGLLASIILNLILIPRYQATGAAITVLLTNAFMFLLGALELPRIILLRPRKILTVFGKVLAAVMIMSVFVYFLKTYLNIFLVVILAGGIYFLLLLVMRALRIEDVKSIALSFKK